MGILVWYMDMDMIRYGLGHRVAALRRMYLTRLCGRGCRDP